MFNKKEYYRNYYKKNKERYIKYIRKYQNSQKGKRKKKVWEDKNKEKLSLWRKNYWIKRKEKNKSILLQKLLLVRLRRIVKRYLLTGKIILPKINSNIDHFNFTEYQKIELGIGGIDYEGIIKYLEPFPKDFLEKYTIDHIKPLCLFDFNKAKEIKKCFAPENHQILTIKENQIKGKKWKEDK
jgi:hypothetical protein